MERYNSGEGTECERMAQRTQTARKTIGCREMS